MELSVLVYVRQFLFIKYKFKVHRTYKFTIRLINYYTINAPASNIDKLYMPVMCDRQCYQVLYNIDYFNHSILNTYLLSDVYIIFQKKTTVIKSCFVKQESYLSRDVRNPDCHMLLRSKDSTIYLLPKFEISSPMPVQPGLCRTWSETLNTVFLPTMLIL